nr:hypothetical protein [Pseudomonas koreensis]
MPGGQDQRWPDWGLSIRLGGSGARWVPVRTWASLTAVGRFADSVGIKGFSVEL